MAAHLSTLQRLESVAARWIVPGHGRPVREARPLVAANRAALEATAAAVCSLCARPAGFEEILAGLCRQFAIELNPSQYVLVGGTLRAYLAWLAYRGTLRPGFESGRMLWRVS